MVTAKSDDKNPWYSNFLEVFFFFFCLFIFFLFYNWLCQQLCTEHLFQIHSGPFLDQISVQLSNAVHCIICEKCTLILWNTDFWRVFLMPSLFSRMIVTSVSVTPVSQSVLIFQWNRSSSFTLRNKTFLLFYLWLTRSISKIWLN